MPQLNLVKTEMYTSHCQMKVKKPYRVPSSNSECPSSRACTCAVCDSIPNHKIENMIHNKHHANDMLVYLGNDVTCLILVLIIRTPMHIKLSNPIQNMLAIYSNMHFCRAVAPSPVSLVSTGPFFPSLVACLASQISMFAQQTLP